MWNDLHLSLAECRVYAYIYGLSHGEKGGYDGSKRGLAKALGLSEACVRDTLNALKEKSLISYTNGLWQSESRTTEDNAHSVRTDDAQSVRESANSVRESAHSVRPPKNPLYNNIKERKDMKPDPDFLKFKEAYINAALFYHTGCYNGREGAENWFKYRGALCEERWHDMSEIKKQAILDELKMPDGFWKSNPEFFLQDFPDPQPEWKTGGEKDEDLVQVKYNGAFKICTRETMKRFNLEWVRDW